VCPWLIRQHHVTGKVVDRVGNLFAFAKHALFKVDVAPVKLGYVDVSDDS